jgi:hypothetical protein
MRRAIKKIAVASVFGKPAEEEPAPRKSVAKKEDI